MEALATGHTECGNKLYPRFDCQQYRMWHMRMYKIQPQATLSDKKNILEQNLEAFATIECGMSTCIRSGHHPL